MAVALYDLSRDWRGLESQPFAHTLLDFGVQVSERADGAGNLAIAYPVARGDKPLFVSLVVCIVERKHQSESSRLGVNAMCTAYHLCVFELHSAAVQRLAQAFKVFEYYAARVAHQ